MPKYKWKKHKKEKADISVVIDDILQVSRISITYLSSAPEDPQNGDCYWDEESGTFSMYDNGNWYQFGDAI